MFDKDVVSIDIGTQNTKIVVGKQQGTNIIVSSAFMFSTPVNSIQDGKIMDMEGIVREIRKALNENKVKAKKAIVTIESTAIIRREIELPLVKPEEMESMVKYEIEQYLPIMLSEYVIEYKIVEEFMEDKLRKCKILVAALPTAMAEDLLLLLKTLGLTPHVLDINSNAISKLFSFKTQINDMTYAADKTVAVLDFGYNNINLTIVSKGATRFSRLITQGGNDIDINTANSFNLEMQQAEEKKIKEGNLNSISGASSLEGMFNDIIKHSIDRWIDEIQRMFQYYTSRETQNKIDEIYIHGGSSALKGLTDYIKTNLNIPASKIESFSNIKTGKQNNIGLHHYLNAVGAIIRK